MFSPNSILNHNFFYEKTKTKAEYYIIFYSVCFCYFAFQLPESIGLEAQKNQTLVVPHWHSFVERLFSAYLPDDY